MERLMSSTRYIWDRIFGPRVRADQLHDLRLRLSAEANRCEASPIEVEMAVRLRVLREESVALTGKPEACQRCARPRNERWPGGHCCSAETRHLFTDSEVAALRLAGTRPNHLRPPASEQAGCAFRGPRGCSLEAAHRPNLCVRYTCRELQTEIDERSDGPAIVQLNEQLRILFEHFVTKRDERIESAHLAELEASLRHRNR